MNKLYYLIGFHYVNIILQKKKYLWTKKLFLVINVIEEFKPISKSFCSSKFFVGVPHLATYIFFSNEPELGTEIDSGMVMTPFSILDERRFEPPT